MPISSEEEVSTPMDDMTYGQIVVMKKSGIEGAAQPVYGNMTFGR